MGFFFRKSINLGGGLRLNLSKSGIGASVGVKGFRVGVKANGKSYIHAGAHGIYFREEYGKANQPQQLEQPLQEVEYDNSVEFNSVNSSSLVHSSKKELLKQLNSSYNKFRWDYLCLFANIPLGLYTYFNFSTTTIISLVLLVTANLAVHIWEIRRRTVDLIYDFDPCAAYRFLSVK